jgi:hypothetical protein
MQAIRTAAAGAVLGIVLLFPFTSQTLAQEQTPPQQPPSPQPTDLNETQLRSFAKLYVEIEKILKSYEPQLKGAKTPEEAKQLENDEMSKLHQVLTQEGMDEQSYSRFIQTANADDGLRKKLVGYINEERQKS